MKGISREQFEKLCLEFGKDMRIFIVDTMKDMDNRLSFIKGECDLATMKHRLVLSILVSELALLLAMYDPSVRQEMIKGIFKFFVEVSDVLDNPSAKEIKSLNGEAPEK